MTQGNDKVEVVETQHERLWRTVKDQYRIREQASDLLVKITDGDVPSAETITQGDNPPPLALVFEASIEYLDSIRKETQDILSRINEVLYSK